MENFKRAAATIIDRVVIPDETAKIIEWLCLYFSDDPEFENCHPEWLLSERPSLKKGICLIGPNGIGKTFSFEVFQRLSSFGFVKRYFQMNDTPTVAMDIGKNGLESLAKYGNGDRVFNELGSEQVAKFYGNNIDSIVAIVFERDISTKNHRTHFTTNYDSEQLADRYGSAFFSRMRGMCNIVQFFDNSSQPCQPAIDLRGFSQRINQHINYSDIQYRWDDYFGIIREIEAKEYSLEALPVMIEELAHRLESVKCLYPGIFGQFITKVDEFINNNVHPENYRRHAKINETPKTEIEQTFNQNGIGDIVRENLRHLRENIF